jgi:hypothetical protein
VIQTISRLFGRLKCNISRMITKLISKFLFQKVFDCITIGLNVEKLEDDNEFQDLVLTVHHAYMHTTVNIIFFIFNCRSYGKYIESIIII